MTLNEPIYSSERKLSGYHCSITKEEIRWNTCSMMDPTDDEDDIGRDSGDTSGLSIENSNTDVCNRSMFWRYLLSVQRIILAIVKFIVLG